MMLLRPNPGSCVDRQTILLLKCEHAEQIKLKDGTGAINSTQWVDEHRALQIYLEREWFVLAPKAIKEPFDQYLFELKAANAMIWKFWAAASDAPDADMVRVLNKHRAALVAKINALFEIRTVEKLF